MANIECCGKSGCEETVYFSHDQLTSLTRTLSITLFLFILRFFLTLYPTYLENGVMHDNGDTDCDGNTAGNYGDAKLPVLWAA